LQFEFERDGEVTMTDYLVLKLFMLLSFLTLCLGIWLSLPSHNVPKYLGLNSTVMDNGTCRYTWLGGTDYESFVGNLSVDRVDIGHPKPKTVIHVGRCNAVVRMWMKDVKSWVQLYPKAGGI
jgi:hypothetical protein